VSDRGVTCKETGVATPVTVKTVLPLTEPRVAEIVVVPAPALVAKPAAEIVATAGLLDAQVTLLVMSCVLVWVPVKYVPVAVNCCVFGLATDGFAGATAIDCRTGAAVTVSVAAGEVTPCNVAVMFEVPAATPVANPPAEIVATEVLEEAQVTDVETSVELLSL
jgi:hypothetical protein